MIKNRLKIILLLLLLILPKNSSAHPACPCAMIYTMIACGSMLLISTAVTAAGYGCYYYCSNTTESLILYRKKTVNKIASINSNKNMSELKKTKVLKSLDKDLRWFDAKLIAKRNDYENENKRLYNVKQNGRTTKPNLKFRDSKYQDKISKTIESNNNYINSINNTLSS